MRRSAKVYYRDMCAGIAWQDDDGYGFVYDGEYVDGKNPAISLTLPLRKEPYLQNTMLPFFDGLIPEGWLLDITAKNWKLDNRDRMGLLLKACKDCIGAISIEPENEEL